MFGQTKPFSFGSTGSGFGGQAATTFGTATQPTFGSFGSQNQQNSMFGSAANTTGSSLFGSTTPAFGSSTGTQSTGFSFGQTATPQSGGLFGSNQTGGLFATPATKTSTFGGFGNNTSTSTSLFGGTSTSTGSKLFGGSGTTSNLFGTATTFGTTALNGTTVKFNPPSGSDTMLKNGISTSISTKHQCITAMKEYETKSLEELRVEDYLANRKGPTTTGTGSLFGTGTQAMPAFGGGTTGFSLSTPATKSGFGGFGGFAATATTGPQTNIFGGTQQKSLFGSAATTTSTASTGFGGFIGGGTNLFANSIKPAFGGTTTGFGTSTNNTFGGTSTGFGGFGSGTNTGSSLFSNKAAFGTTTTTPSNSGTGFSFGSTANTGSSLFGGNANKTATGGFGGFGTVGGTGFNTGGTSMFSQNKPTGFGVGTGTTGFGTSTGFCTQLGGTGLFGANTQTSTGFNTNPLGLQNTQQATLGATASNVNAAAAQQAQIQHQLIALTNSPYGDSPLFRNLTQDPSKREDLKPTNPAAQKAILSQASQYKVGGAIRTTPKVKAKPLNSLLADGKSQLFEGLEEADSSFGGNDTFMPRKSVKKLVIKKSSPNNSSLSSSFMQSRNDDLVAPATTYSGNISMTTPQKSIEQQVETPEVILGSKSVGRPSLSDERPSLDDTISVLNAKNKKQLDSVDSLQEEFSHDADSDRSVSPPPVPHPTGIVLHRPGYYTFPTLDELAGLVDNNGDCFVENFTVGREGYGSVFFPGETNVANMNLDEIVHFRRKEITIYPDDNNKPEEGLGLNKRAEVTLDCVWPTDKTTRSPIKSPDRLKLMNYHDKIELSTMRIGAKFIDYRPETGSWVFEVKHFSKYGLADDSDDEVDGSEANIKKLKMLQQQQLHLQKQKIQLTNGKQPPATVKQQQVQQHLPNKQLAPPVEILQEPMVDDEDSDMEDIEREALPVVPSDGDDEMPDDDGEAQTVPVSHRIAQSMRVDPRNVQMMKASFFGSDDENETDNAGLGGVRVLPQRPLLPKPPVTPQSPARPAEKSALNRSLLGSLLKPQYVSPLPLVEERARQPSPVVFEPRMKEVAVPRSLMQPPPMEHQIIPSGMTRTERPRRVVGSRTQKLLPEFSKSLMYNKQHMIMDAGLFMGRSFRVGWGPNWTLAHSGGPLHAQKTNVPGTGGFSLLPGYTQRRTKQLSPFNVVQQRVDTNSSPSDDEVVKATCEANLTIQLKHSESTLQDDCPVFATTPGVDALHDYAENAQKQLEFLPPDTLSGLCRQHHLVWSLCCALWGRLPQDELEELEEGSYAHQQARREAVSSWLEESSRDAIKQEIQAAQLKGDAGNLASVFSLLSGRQVSESCSMSRKAGDHRLALLLAQSGGNGLPRQMIKKQLAEWCEQKVDRYISADRLKIYCLLGGALTWQASDKFINTCRHLDWKRALAVHLWYHCPPTASVADALRSYDEAFESKTAYAKGPFPPYMTDGSRYIEQEEDPDHVTKDTCYHLLTMYSKRSHRLEQILAPTGSTPNQLDYSLSWHLSQVLQALGYTHLSEYHLDSINCQYAAQLESLDLWQWAAFVLLHIQERSRREMCVRQLLERHISLNQSEETRQIETFLQDQLLIPNQWIHHAKAMRSRYEDRKKDEAWHLLKAGHWNDGHQVVLRHIAPDCIINENYDYLKQFLAEMAEPSRNATIKDWSTGGSLYADYIALVEGLETLKREEPDMYELERLQPDVMSLCARVSNLYCHNAKTRLCQSEMAKKAANLHRTLLMLQKQGTDKGSSSSVSARLLAPLVSQLPLPEDYALQELRQLTRSYMLEMTS